MVEKATCIIFCPTQGAVRLRVPALYIRCMLIVVLFLFEFAHWFGAPLIQGLSLGTHHKSFPIDPALVPSWNALPEPRITEWIACFSVGCDTWRHGESNSIRNSLSKQHRSFMLFLQIPGHSAFSRGQVSQPAVSVVDSTPLTFRSMNGLGTDKRPFCAGVIDPTQGNEWRAAHSNIVTYVNRLENQSLGVKGANSAV